MNGWMGRLTDRQTDKQTDRQTDRPSVPIFPGQSRFLDPVPGVPTRGEMSREKRSE